MTSTIKRLSQISVEMQQVRQILAEVEAELEGFDHISWGFGGIHNLCPETIEPASEQVNWERDGF